MLGGGPGCDDDGGGADDDDHHDNDEGYNDDSVVPADIEDDVEDPLQSVEYLDAQNGLWHSTCDMPSPNSLLQLATINASFMCLVEVDFRPKQLSCWTQ